MSRCTYFINGRRRLRLTLSLNCGLKIMQFASRSEKLKTEGKISRESFRNTVCSMHLSTGIPFGSCSTELEV